MVAMEQVVVLGLGDDVFDDFAGARVQVRTGSCEWSDGQRDTRCLNLD